LFATRNNPPWSNTTLIRGGAGAGEWQERLIVMEVARGASTIAAEVRRWLIKSEERDNRPILDRLIEGGGSNAFHQLRAYQNGVTVRRSWINECRRLFGHAQNRPESPQQLAPCIPWCIPLKR